MFQQYDQWVKVFEGELVIIQGNFGQQFVSRDDQIRLLQEQVNIWRLKYEVFVKFYFQFCYEYFDFFQKFKVVQFKVVLVQEVIDRCEKLECEIKMKNFELVDMICECDRVFYEKDRLMGFNKDEVEKFRCELCMVFDCVDNLECSKGNEFFIMFFKYNCEMVDFEEVLCNKMWVFEDVQVKFREGSFDLEMFFCEKEEELEVYKVGMDQMLIEFNELKNNQGVLDQVFDGQFDVIILVQFDKINEIIDLVFQVGVQCVDDVIYEFDLIMQVGNQNVLLLYVLLQIEKVFVSVIEFVIFFNNFIVDGFNSIYVELIKNINVFLGVVVDVCSNFKGFMCLVIDEKKVDVFVNGVWQLVYFMVKFFCSLLSFCLEGMDFFQKIDVVINSNNEVQMNLQRFNKFVEGFVFGFGKFVNKGDFGEMVDQEFNCVVDVIVVVVVCFQKFKNKFCDGYFIYEFSVYDFIFDVVMVIIIVIVQFIKVVIVIQQEIV